jgi:hypothetical protein
MLIDALMSAEAAYKLELYVESGGVGGVVWALDDSKESGEFLFADSDLAKLLSKFMQYVQQQPSEGVVGPEQADPTPEQAVWAQKVPSAAVADATGIPE